MARRSFSSLWRAPLTLWEQAAAHIQQRKALSLRPGEVGGQPHGLGSRLVVSLTSYPARFRFLKPTLQCLLTQSVRPDLVVLWLSSSDREQLPDSILELTRHGLTIETCEDLRSYNKIIPSLLSFPDAFIVTADDDMYYWHTWLQELVAGVTGEREVVCHRGHRVRVDESGRLAPYSTWTFNTKITERSRLIFPTGVGGVIYPPGILHPDVVDASRIKALCPTADDIWLYWMGLRNRASFRKIGPRRHLLSWPGTQSIGLHRQNVIEHANDQQIRNMTDAFEPLDFR